MNLLEFMVDLNNPPGTIKAFSKDIDPNDIYPWQTWERYAKGRTLVGVDEDNEDFATAGLELGEKEQKLAAAIGATNNASARIGYAAEGRIPGISAYTYSIEGSYTVNNTTSINHSTPVRRLADGAEASLIQPSITVYYWLRTA